jgi:hypothetical protein
MNRTTTVVVALIAAASLSTMAYAVPTQRAFACHFGCGVPYPVPVPVPVPVFGGFFVHKTIIQTINQVNNCTGNGGDQKTWYGEDHNQKDKQTICLNTAVNTAGRGLGANGVGSGNLGNTG